MEILKQFIESSLAVNEKILELLDENERVKNENAKLKSKSQPEPHICDLMPIGETFCGLKVVKHDKKDEAPIDIETGGMSQWLTETAAREIYKAEMELSELRGMKSVVKAVEDYVNLPTSANRMALDLAYSLYLKASK